MYVNVLVPLPLAGAFTYRLSDGRIADVQVGSRVVVPFGPKRRYTGIVTQVDVPEPSGGIAVKDVLAVMDPEPLILPSQLALWRWIADYYLCTEGDVMKAALPSGFNIESDSLASGGLDVDLGEGFRVAGSLSFLSELSKIVPQADTTFRPSDKVYLAPREPKPWER